MTSSHVSSAKGGADGDWYLCAMRGVRVMAHRRQYITSDDVWLWLLPLEVTTSDNRAMGSVMRESQRDGVITLTSNFLSSARSCNHRRPQRVWKSLIYTPDTPPHERTPQRQEAH